MHLTLSSQSECFERQALDLIDRCAATPRDCAWSDLRPILPSGDESFDSEVGRGRVALLAMCVRHIRETGDGGFSMFLGDALQHLPECEAYVSMLIEADRVAFDASEFGSRRLAGNMFQSGDVSVKADRPSDFCHGGFLSSSI